MKPKILIVDDDEDVCTLYGSYLRRQDGWEVLTTNNGEDALEILDASFHAVVLDEQMPPGICGTEVLRRIRLKPNLQHLCVVMLTAVNDAATIVNAFNHKPSAFLRKMNARPKDLYATLVTELRNVGTLSLRPLSVFLCHSHSDKSAVLGLYYRLKRDLVEPWLDRETLVPGQDWDQEIRKALTTTDIVAVCLSSNAIAARGFVQTEIRRALRTAKMQPAGTIFVVPLRLEPCEIPPSLAKLQWVDLFEKDGYDQFLRAIQFKTKQLGLTAAQ